MYESDVDHQFLYVLRNFKALFLKSPFYINYELVNKILILKALRWHLKIRDEINKIKKINQ